LYLCFAVLQETYFLKYHLLTKIHPKQNSRAQYYLIRDDLFITMKFINFSLTSSTMSNGRESVAVNLPDLQSGSTGFDSRLHSTYSGLTNPRPAIIIYFEISYIIVQRTYKRNIILTQL